MTDATGRHANARPAQPDSDTRHHIVLAVLAAGGGTSQKSVAEALGLDRSIVVALVGALESQELVRRIQSREDRQANSIEMMAKVKRVLKHAEQLMQECERDFVGVLEREERAQLTSLLERLVANA